MSLSISANTNFYECIQMQFLHIVVETVLHSRQLESLDLRQWVRVVCYRAKKVIPPLHITLVRLIDLSLLKNRADTWFLISSDILVFMDANWKESGRTHIRKHTNWIVFCIKSTFSSIFSIYLSKSSLCTQNFIFGAGFLYQPGQWTNISLKIKHLHFHQVHNES